MSTPTYTYSSLIPDHRAEQAGRFMLEHPVPEQRAHGNPNAPEDVNVTAFRMALGIGPTLWSEYRKAGANWILANERSNENWAHAWRRTGLNCVPTHHKPKALIPNHTF